MPIRRVTFAVLLTILSTPMASADVTVTRGNNLSVSVASDGRMAIDLLGELWIVPSSGGDALQLTQDLRSAQRPRWSPDASALTFQASIEGTASILLFDIKTRTSRALTDASSTSKQPTWHPSGERIAYSAYSDQTGFDLWEVDVATGLTWRLSSAVSNELEPAWSADGRDLVYVTEHNGSWSLVLRQQGRSDEKLLSSNFPISAPSFRPDGSLITYLQASAMPVAGRNTPRKLNMVILSTPRLVRTLANNDSFDNSPISWLDRMRMIYSASGEIRSRHFDEWRSRNLHFRAAHTPPPAPRRNRERPVLAWPNEPSGELIIHAERLFDGLSDAYQLDVDILIRGGKVAAIDSHSVHSGGITIDMGDLAVIPGLIDADARLASGLRASHGPDILTTGVTTVVGHSNRANELSVLWTAKNIPGPRLLDASELALGLLPRPELDVTAAVATSRMVGGLSGHSLAAQIALLIEAGLSAPQTLRSLGVNAAAALQLDPYLGRIAIGASADLVFVDGDPLSDARDALNVVAVVRNGRFYSVSGLIDRAKAAENVE